jgi:hypothetical protein
LLAYLAVSGDVNSVFSIDALDRLCRMQCGKELEGLRGIETTVEGHVAGTLAEVVTWLVEHSHFSSG